MPVSVKFTYDEATTSWVIEACNVTSPNEAVHATNAVIHSILDLPGHYAGCQPTPTSIPGQYVMSLGLRPPSGGFLVIATKGNINKPSTE